MEDYLVKYFGPLLVSFMIALTATPMVAKLAKKNRILDHPGSHKTHIEAIPLLGGLAIFIGFSITIIIFIDIDSRVISLSVAAVLLVITGLIDDIFDLNALVKLIGQTSAALIVVLGNLDQYRFMIDYFDRFYIPDFIVLILITGWIVLVINALNLIDGIDGLAVGTAAIIFLAMAIVSVIIGGNPNIIGIQLIGFGACLGFIVFNFYPAKIFMGDAGSMLLGFILATTYLYTIKYPFSAQLVLGSMFIFAYPALDISYTMFRRLCCKVSIFKADQGHIHHILLSLGFSVRKTVLMIYLVNIIFAALAVVLLTLQIPAPFILLIGIATIIFVIILFIKLLTISRKNGIDGAS